MEKEFISDKEAICLLVSFIIGSSLIIGIGTVARNDAWLASIAGILMAVPILAIYSRLISLFQGQDLFDILTSVCGKTIGIMIALVYIFYSLHLGALVIRNFSEFIDIVAMPETPTIVSMIALGAVCIVASRAGIEVLGRTSAFFLPIVIFIIVIVQFLVISVFHIEHLRPPLGYGIKPIIAGGFSACSFPFAETVLFIGVFSSLKTKKSIYKVFRWGILISGLIIIAVTIRNIGVLGNMVGNFYFPSYAAVGKIRIGDFIQRIEVTVAFVFLFGVFAKASVCLLVASKGVSKLLHLKDYRSIVIQMGVLMIIFAYVIYDNSVEMKYWAFKVYPYYAFPMQVLLPVAVWIAAEVKVKKDPLKGYHIPE
jgi:spore germination protein KB